jgi:hypothetical protein
MAGHADNLQRLLRILNREPFADGISLPQLRRQPLVDDGDTPTVNDVVV